VVTLTPRPEDVRHLGEVVRARSGLVLTEDQAYLVESRLTPLARRLGFPSLAALMAAVRQPASEALLDAVTEAMTTNETSFSATVTRSSSCVVWHSLTSL
jgi:chemotaxis protein methyltransferase CheR